MKICIITDAWSPQVNGVVRTLKTLKAKLREKGHSVLVIHPGLFMTVACPGYKEIRLSLNAPLKLKAILKRVNADAYHIATEGPLGWAARRYFMRHKIKFSTAYHTDFPQYIAARLPLSPNWIYSVLRRFHGAAEQTLVATKSIQDLLSSHGFTHLMDWSRGVDQGEFSPNSADQSEAPLPFDPDDEGPILLYVGRIAVEKNLRAFLDLEIDGLKVVVGDGPDIEMLKREYADALFTGVKFGEELRALYASADVFVFPSKTDTFGLVMIEALACGTPVAAYPVQGPLDIVGLDGKGTKGPRQSIIGALNDDLAIAIKQALDAREKDCLDYVKFYNWDSVTDEFLAALQPAAAAQDLISQAAE